MVLQGIEAGRERGETGERHRFCDIDRIQWSFVERYIFSPVSLGVAARSFDFGLLVALIVVGFSPTDLFAAERAFLCISELVARVVLRGTSLLEADQPEQQEKFETQWSSNCLGSRTQRHDSGRFTLGRLGTRRDGLDCTKDLDCLWSDSGAGHVSLEGRGVSIVVLKDRQAIFTSGATPERARLEGAIPFKARVHLPWERLLGRTPRCVMGVIPSTRAPSPRPA